MIEYLTVIGFCDIEGKSHKKMFEGCNIVLVETTSPDLGSSCGVHPLSISELSRNGFTDVEVGNQFMRRTTLTQMHDININMGKQFKRLDQD